MTKFSEKVLWICIISSRFVVIVAGSNMNPTSGIHRRRASAFWPWRRLRDWQAGKTVGWVPRKRARFSHPFPTDACEKAAASEGTISCCQSAP